MKKPDSKKILVSLTGKTLFGFKKKLLEVEKYKIKEVALFLEFYSKKQKKKIYELLLNSNIKKIPLVHARNDMELKEFKFLIKNFKTEYFNIHEESFKYLEKWRSIHKKLLLELNYNNIIPSKKDISRIRGFCIDLSHFKAAQDRGTLEYNLILDYRKHKNKFLANHLNGYSKLFKKDLHYLVSLKQLDYLKELPKFLFGKYIALEMFNSIKQQLKFKKYLYKFLKDKL
jgi:hypothetical protein